MRLNIVRSESPVNFLDIIPENASENQMLLDFISNFVGRDDFARVVVCPLEDGGILVTVE